jgi:hypothetical protein
MSEERRCGHATGVTGRQDVAMALIARVVDCRVCLRIKIACQQFRVPPNSELKAETGS